MGVFVPMLEWPRIARERDGLDPKSEGLHKFCALHGLSTSFSQASPVATRTRALALSCRHVQNPPQSPKGPRNQILSFFSLTDVETEVQQG